MLKSPARGGFALPEPEEVAPLGLRARQALLVKCLGRLFQYAYDQGYELSLGEGYVADPRPARGGEMVRDGVHMNGSLHYLRLAQDVNLFVGGEFIKSGDHFAWVDLSDFWQRLDPLCSSGRSFNDSNHFAVRFNGKR